MQKSQKQPVMPSGDSSASAPGRRTKPNQTLPKISQLSGLDRPGLAAGDNQEIQAAMPGHFSFLEEMAEEYLELHPLGPDTPLSERKVLNFIFEKAAALIREEKVSLPAGKTFSREVKRVLARGPNNIGPAGYGCAVENLDDLLAFLEYRKFLFKGFDARADVGQLLSMKKEYVQFVLNQIPIRKNIRILDLGCGYGTIAYHLARPGSLVVGVDYSFARVEKLAPLFEQLSEKGRIQIRWGDVTNLPFPDGSFDQVVSADLAEHLGAEEQLSTLAEINRVLRPGGEWFISTPNLHYLRLTTLARKFLAVKCAGGLNERHRRWRAERIPYTPGAAVGHGQHIGLLTSRALKRLARKAGLRPTETAYYTRSDILAWFPRHTQALLRRRPLQEWISSWFLLRGIHPISI